MSSTPRSALLAQALLLAAVPAPAADMRPLMAASRSVVALRVHRTGEGGELAGRMPEFRGPVPPEYGRFFSWHFRNRERIDGSGVVVHERGIVVTNEHVVRGAASVKARVQGSGWVPARLLGADERSDIAVLRLEGAGPFRALEFSDQPVRTGMRVYAIGSPFGLPGTLTEGIVSDPARLVPPEVIARWVRSRVDVFYGGLIQTDAPLNSGSSGGALLDERGRMVGMTVLICSSGTVTWQGVGFAIPVTKIRRRLPVLEAGGEVEYGYLGVSPRTLDAPLGEALKLGTTQGVLIEEVQPGSPAAEAGLSRGECLVAFEGRPLRSDLELAELANDTPPGTEVGLEVVSPGGARRSVKVRLGKRPRRGGGKSSVTPGELAGTWRGVVFESTRGLLRVKRVVPGSPAHRAGLAAGVFVDEIMAGGKRIELGPAEDVVKALEGVPGPVAFHTDLWGYVAVEDR